MATLRQKELLRGRSTGPGPVSLFVKRNRLGLGIAGGIVVAVIVAVALVHGMRINVDLKASQLFSRAKTLEDFQAILQQVPNSYLTFDVLINLGNLSHAQGKREEALRYYGQALQRFSRGFRGASALCALGMLSQENKEYAKAIDYFNKAIEADPAGVKAPEALFQWARTLEVSGNKAGAKEKYDRLQNEFSATPWAREAAVSLKGLTE